jgi:DnaD/phage-associated family protein
VYSEALDNPKLQRLSGSAFKGWFNLACLANVSEPRGALPPLPVIAFRLRLSERQAKALLEELVAARLVDVTGDGYALHHWDTWQYESDLRDTNGRRTADDTRRNEGETRVLSPPFRRRNGGDSVVGSAVTDTDTETDTETETETESETDQNQNQNQRFVPPPREVVVVFEQGFGRLLTPTELELITALQEEHPRERIEYAVREAAALNKRSVRYVQRICERDAGGESRDRIQSAGRVAERRHEDDIALRAARL